MIQTEVKKLGVHEYQVHVTVPQGEYDRIYAEQIQKLSRQAKLPGFRPGKTPVGVIKQKFGPKLHDDTVSELLQTHYIKAIESSGLNPAIQPQLDIPEVQPSEGFEFTIKVTTWPEVAVSDLSKLKFAETTIEVGGDDIQSVIDRLMKSQVTYRLEEEGKLEEGDQAHIDFVGSIDGEEFEGGKGENVALVIGEGRFIPGFEDQLTGKAAGEDVTIGVTFPDDYQAAHLAGKAASFAAVVRSVGKPETADNEDALAKMLNFEDEAAFRADIESRLGQEAEQASYTSTRDAALDALLAADAIKLPEALVEQDMLEVTKRVVENMKEQGVEAKREMFADEAFKKEVRKRSERGLKLSLLLQSVRERGELSVDDAEIDTEIDRQAQQYPEDQHEQFKSWLKGQKEQMASMREGLLERKCVAYIVSQAKTTAASKALSVWQQEQEQNQEGA
jgi:trigger factor